MPQCSCDSVLVRWFADAIREGDPRTAGIADAVAALAETMAPGDRTAWIVGMVENVVRLRPADDLADDA